MLGNFSCFCYFLLTFFKTFSKISFRNTLKVSNGLNPDFCWSWSGSKRLCLIYQQMTKVTTSKEKVNGSFFNNIFFLFFSFLFFFYGGGGGGGSFSYLRKCVLWPSSPLHIFFEKMMLKKKSTLPESRSKAMGKLKNCIIYILHVLYCQLGTKVQLLDQCQK